MNLAKKILTNFKNQPDIWFFFGFLLTFTLSIRKVLFHFPIKENFNEYSGIYIYLSDIFLILTFIFWFISILCNNLLSLSRIRLWITRVLHNLYIILPLFLVFLSFLSILWSGNKSIAIFRSIKLLEFYLLYIYIIFRIVPRGTIFTSPNPSPYKGEGGSEDSTSTQVQIVPRGTIQHLKLIVLSGFIILTSVFIIIKPNINSLFLNSLNERLFYLNVPRGTFESDPVFGLGAGQSALSMQKYFPQKLEFWQYQPVHNVFLLIFSELGLIGLGLFIWWLWKLFYPVNSDNVPRGTLSEHGAGSEQKEKNLTPFSLIRKRAGDEVDMEQEYNDYILHNDNTYLSSTIFSRYFQGILLGLIFIMLFDHYLWDIQQGSLLFWLTAGFITGIRTMHNKKSA